MLRKLRLTNFKNFKDVEFEFGGLTVLVGTNAVGKSNVCEALRFLSAMGRGYTLAQAIGGHCEDGRLQWRGIRGWMSEIAFYGESTFSIEATFVVNMVIGGHIYDSPRTLIYKIEVDTGIHSERIESPRILFESLSTKSLQTHRIIETFCTGEVDKLWLRIDGKSCPPVIDSSRSLMAQINLSHELKLAVNSIRDFDWNPRVMRDSVLPGYPLIGDRGEGLVSVLQAVFQDDELKNTCLDWLKALTSTDVTDLEFIREASGKIALQLIESGGRKISIASASDGTLRFLAMLAAYFSPTTHQLYFVEELENGIHPTRLHLLLQLIEQRAEMVEIQTIATTHSPQLLRLLNEDSLYHVYVIYRSDDRSDAQVRRLIDIPNIREVLETMDLGELLESGWMETTLSFERNTNLD